MESWKKGQDELLDVLTQLCTKIGNNVAAETDEKNSTRITKVEYHSLQQNSNQVVILAEENKRLTKELIKCNELARRIEALEKENKRLAGALDHAVQQQQFHQVGTPDVQSTPRPSGPPSSAGRIEDGDSDATIRQKFHRLEMKYNRKSINHSEVVSSNSHLQEKFRASEQKNRDWLSHCESQKRLLAKKDEQIRRLRANLAGRDVEHGNMLGPPSSELSKQASSSSLSSGLQVPISPVKIEVGDDTGYQSVSPPQQGSSRQAGTARFAETSTEPDVLELPQLEEGQMRVEDTQFVQLEVEHHSSSTQDDQASPEKAALVPQVQVDDSENVSSDDIPIVVSSRSVKKRKMRHNEAEPIPNPKIKLERLGSSPIGIAAFRYLNQSESFDLDDIGQKVDTPKKQRRMLQLSRRASTVSQNASSQKSQEPISQNPKEVANAIVLEASQHEHRTRLGRRTGTALQPVSTNMQILPRISDHKSPKKRRIVSDKAVEDLAEDDQTVFPQEKSSKSTTTKDVTLNDLLAKPSPLKRVLSPVQANRIGLPKAGLPNIKSRGSASSAQTHEVRHPSGYDSDRKTSSRSQQSGGLRDVTRPSSKGTPRSPAEPTKVSPMGISRGRVEPVKTRSRANQAEYLTKLERPSPKTPNLASSPSSRNYRTPSLCSRFTPLEVQRNAVEPSKSSATRKTPLGANPELLDMVIEPDDEPLRCRPVSMLDLDDFKVNPKYNQGYNYAFRDVVRRKSDRQCLPGCTRPECCGNANRAMALLIHDNGRPITLSQEERDEALLEDYMGDNAYKIRNMSESERYEMLLQAKTRDMANRTGKHRHAYQRRPSPPGFWEVDFPTTQEEMVNRERSKDFERELVRERYEQAMRPGGAYIFRDE